MAKSPDQTIYVLNGPNLNMLGTREPETYGHARLADVEKLCVDTAAQFGLKADCRQSNREGELIDFIHEAHAKKAAGIIINAGGYSHTSIALHDALKAVQDPDRRGAHHQHPRARELPAPLLHRHGRVCQRCAASASTVTGLRSTGLAAKIGVKAKSLTPPPSTQAEFSDQDHGAPA